MTPMNVLVTGAAGFIGFHVSKRLLEDGYRVVGFDNVNDYYDIKLKYSRLEILHQYDCFTFYKNDLANQTSVEKVFSSEHLQRVIHLAAQAGVRRSPSEPEVYLQSNIK